MDIGMATVKLSTEADRLIDWLLKFKPEQKYITFPNRFGGHEIVKLLPRMAKKCTAHDGIQYRDGIWTYRDFEIRFPPLADVHVKHRDIKPDTLRAKLELNSLYGKFGSDGKRS